MYSSDLLIAPRPVRIPALSALSSSTSSTSPVSLRISSPSSQPDPSRLSPNPTADTTSRSPRLSPRPSSEVLDEFFSILRPAIPSLFPTQPLPRFYNIPSLHDRALSLSSSGPASPPFSADGSKHTAAFLARTRSPGLDDNEEAEDGDVPTPLLSFGPQGSPISRIHTRNPFQRHPSYDYHSPSATPKFSPRSPAMYPLPPPTPSELEVY